MKIFIYISLLIFCSNLFSDDIYFKSGRMIKNVKIIDSDKTSVAVRRNMLENNELVIKEYRILKSSILKIEYKLFDGEVETEVSVSGHLKVYRLWAVESVPPMIVNLRT